MLPESSSAAALSSLGQLNIQACWVPKAEIVAVMGLCSSAMLLLVLLSLQSMHADHVCFINVWRAVLDSVDE